MKIIEINVYKDRKLQISEFEPYSFGFGARAELGENDDVMESYSKLEEFVDKKIEIETLKWNNPQKLVRKVNSGKIHNEFLPF